MDRLGAGACLVDAGVGRVAGVSGRDWIGWGTSFRGAGFELFGGAVRVV